MAEKARESAHDLDRETDGASIVVDALLRRFGEDSARVSKKGSLDDLGDRMKGYEALTQSIIPPTSCYVIRVDGRSFHTYTRPFSKPFDTRIEAAMEAAAEALLKEVSKSILCYTQSDEISLLVDAAEQHWFGGKVQKIVSVAASAATCGFGQSMCVHSVTNRRAMFDARVFPLSLAELPNYLIWRQRDCIRNSIQATAQAHFSHKELQGKNTADIQAMLTEAGTSWGEVAPARRFGRVSRKVRHCSKTKDGVEVVRTRVETSAVGNKLSYGEAEQLIQKAVNRA